MKSVLVTGTSGYVGSCVRDHLQSKGVDVTEVPGRMDFVEKVRHALSSEIKVVIHAGFAVDFSSREVEQGESANISNTRALVELCNQSKVKHLVFISAAGVFGVSNAPQARNELDLGATDPGFEVYRDSRYIQEKLLCENIVREFRGSVSVVYPTTVYGQSMPLRVKRHFEKLRGMNPFVLHPPGGTSFVDQDDLTTAIETIVDQGTEGRFIVSSGNATYEQLFQAATEALGVRYRKKFVRMPPQADLLIPLADQVLPGRFVNAAILRSSFGFKYYSTENAIRILGWRPRGLLADTLRKALG